MEVSDERKKKEERKEREEREERSEEREARSKTRNENRKKTLLPSWAALGATPLKLSLVGKMMLRCLKMPFKGQLDPNMTPYMVPRMDSLPRCSYYFWYAASLYHIMA